MWIASLVGCVWISTAHHEASIDADGDGLSLFEDCDDRDPQIGGPTDWFVDVDGDGVGTGEAVNGCGGPLHALEGGDCDDLRPNVFPGAIEVCDPLRVDEDCDGGADDEDPERAEGKQATYIDGDGDGFGVEGSAATACHPGDGVALIGGDCDDTAPGTHPGAVETCGGSDEDCDNAVDEAGAAGELAWFVDADNDGVGAGAARMGCEALPGDVRSSDDCDDADDNRFPGAVETCNGVDDDCNGLVDDAVTTYVDADSDGFGDLALASTGCTEGRVDNADDCNDRVASAFPGGTEQCDDVDHDCDGVVDCDGDGDGYADANQGGSDCDDGDDGVVPGGPECEAQALTCAQLYNRGEPAGVELWTLSNPDGSTWETYCDLTEGFGGGWTLLASSHRNAAGWDTGAVLSPSTFGEPSLGNDDFKGEGYLQQPIDEVLFEDGMQYARHVPGGASATILDRLLAVPNPSCAVSWPMVEGNLSDPQLCDTAVYIHPYDQDGSSCDPYGVNNDNAAGFAWSVSNNGGCPLDDPGGSSFINTSNGPWVGAIRLWGR